MIPSQFTTWQFLKAGLDDEAEAMTSASERASERQQACDGLGGHFISSKLTSPVEMIDMLSQYQDGAAQLTTLTAYMAILAALMSEKASEWIAIMAEAQAAAGVAANMTDASLHQD